MIVLDEFDRYIIFCLSKHKCSFKDIAGELGRSIPFVSKRVNRLIECGILKGLVYEVSNKYNSACCAFVFITLEKDSQYRNILPIISKIKNIEECHYLGGEYTMLCKIYAKDNSSLMGIVKKLQNIECIIDMRFYISLNEGFKFKFK